MVINQHMDMQMQFTIGCAAPSPLITIRRLITTKALLAPAAARGLCPATRQFPPSLPLWGGQGLPGRRGCGAGVGPTEQGRTRCGGPWCDVAHAACAKQDPLLFCWEPGLTRRCTLLVQGERRSRLGAPEQSQQAAPRLSGRRPPTGAERGLLLLLLIAASVAAVHLAPTYTGAFQHMRVHTGRRAQQHSMGLGDAADAGASAGSGSGEHHSGITRTLSFDVCHGFGHQRLSLLSGAALPAAVAAEPARSI